MVGLSTPQVKCCTSFVTMTQAEMAGQDVLVATFARSVDGHVDLGQEWELWEALSNRKASNPLWGSKPHFADC